MVVVVQLFTANQKTQWADIAGVIGTFVVPVTHPVADTVDHSGSPDWNPHHLHRPDPDTVNAKQGQVDYRHQRDAEHLVAAVNIALHPVFRCPLAIALERFGRRRFRIEFGALEQYLANTQDDRAVGIFLGFALGVVFTMDGGPFLGVLRSG